MLLLTNRPDTPTRIQEHHVFSSALLRRTGVARINVADTIVLDRKSRERLADPEKTLDQHVAIVVAGSPVVFLSERDSSTERGVYTQRFLNWGMPMIAEALRRGDPYLGICLGDQAMVAALGGFEYVQSSPVNREVQTVKAIFDPNLAEEVPQLDGIPRELWAAGVHDDSVVRVPRGFSVVGQTARDPRSALYDPDRRAFGLQFHPELVIDDELMGKIANANYQATGPWLPVTPGIRRIIANHGLEAVVFSEMSKASFL